MNLFSLAKYIQERLHEKCNCKEKCEANSYQASVSRASFPSQPILDDIKESLGLSEDEIRFYRFILLFVSFMRKLSVKITEMCETRFSRIPLRIPIN